MAQTRREFIRNTSCGMLAGAAVIKSFNSLFLMNALAQPSNDEDYKALVCIFLFGGNDSNNMVIPYTDTDYNGYAAIRGNLAIPQDQLLQITPPSDGRTFGLHPRMTELANLFNQATDPPVAILVNTGTLIRPTTREQYLAGENKPYQLFSHSDQQTEWQTSNPSGPKATGWGGRLADTFFQAGQFPMITSVAGVTVFSAGQSARPLIISPHPTQLRDVLKLNRIIDRSSIDQILALDRGDGTATLVRGSSAITEQALASADRLNQPDPTINTVFPNTGLGNQMKQIAKVIARRTDLGLTRQIFFASIGGFDTHQNQGQMNGTQGNLLAQVSAAMGAFYAATQELGVASNVTTFTVSDFSRTYQPSNIGQPQVGTDHAWGSHQFVMGDAVNGGDFYGTWPTLALGGPNDSDRDSPPQPRGRWIPTQSINQYGYTLAKWYGMNDADRQLVFPNINEFTTQDLRFMKS